nr:PREDICTED: uncharacterized protein LOC106702237 [Latimeria chalumnae]|eukprot:XP_014339869.1 PREDICTED: uncharacterized protein LOC106702237 [Latimeria chalumnae]
MESIGFKPKVLRLKPGAFPTIFDYEGDDKLKKPERGAFAKQQRLQVLNNIIAEYTSCDHEKILEAQEHGLAAQCIGTERLDKENIPVDPSIPATIECSGNDIDFDLHARSSDFGMQTVKMSCSRKVQMVYCGTSRGCLAKPLLRDAAVCASVMCHDVGTQCTLIGSEEIDPEEESDGSDMECDDPCWEPMEENTEAEDDDIVDDPELDFLRWLIVSTKYFYG